MLHKPINILVIIIFLIPLWSCSDDNPAGADLENAPDAPSFERVEMDFSVFEDADTYNSFNMGSPEEQIEQYHTIQQSSDLTAYEQAAIFARSTEMLMQSIGQFPSIFFQKNQWGDPDMDGDIWTWEWNHSYQGESLTINVTAEVKDNVQHWELRYTTTGTEEDVDNALLIASQVNLDGSGGTWQMYDFMKEEPVFMVDYEIDGEITTKVDISFEQEEDGRILYQRDGDESSLQIWEVLEDGISTIMWNNANGTGSIQSPGYQDGERVCWDEEYRNTGC